MQPVPPDHLIVVGALDQDRTPQGVVPRRFPGWTRHQIVDPRLDLMVSMPSGVRLEVRTDADVLELDVHVTHLQVGEFPVGPAVFDAVVDGDVGPMSSTQEGTVIRYDPFTLAVDIEPGPSTTVRFEGLAAGAGGGLRRIEIWLPQRCVVAVDEVRVPSDAATARPDPSARRSWVHYGSSISHCLEADRPTGIWPAVAARLGGVDVRNLAVAGQCHLDQMVARTIRDLDVDLISIKAGINVINADTMRERTFVSAVHGFLDTVRDGHPTTPVLLVSPIVCPVVEDHPGPTVPLRTGRVGVVERPDEMEEGALTLRRIRELFAQVVDDRRAHGDAHLHLLDGLELFGPDDADGLPDGLHPDAEGYRCIGERFAAHAFGPGGPFAEDRPVRGS